MSEKAAQPPLRKADAKALAATKSLLAKPAAPAPKGVPSPRPSTEVRQAKRFPREVRHTATQARVVTGAMPKPHPPRFTVT